MGAFQGEIKRTHRPLECVDEYRLAPEHLLGKIRDQYVTSRKQNPVPLTRRYPLIDITALS